jgi:hypothetical protein
MIAHYQLILCMVDVETWGITALASATVVFIPPHSLHFGEVTTIDRIFVSEKCNTIK